MGEGESVVAFLHNRRYGLLFLAGLIGEVVLKLIFKA
jgi:hypothetical protein